MSEHRNFDKLLPLSPIAYHILFALVGQERHGYDILKIVEIELETDISPTTLYRQVRKLLEDGLIEESETHKPDDDPRRRYYKLTTSGLKVYAAETRRWARVVRDAVETNSELGLAF